MAEGRWQKSRKRQRPERLQHSRGSLTVETILVLPLCLMVLIIVMSFFQLLQLQLQLQNALNQTIQQQALTAGVEEDGDASYLAAEGEFLLLCQTGGVSFEQVEWGAAGLHLFLTEHESVLQGTLVYRVNLPFLSGWGSQLLCVQQGQSRIWRGRSCQHGESDTRYAYYTEYGTVYHRYLDCTHLKLSIRPVTEEGLAFARNQYGGKYSLCELCGEDKGESSFYITAQGDRYHTGLDCSALTRYIKTIPIEEISELGMRQCSRCEKRN